MGQSYSPYSKPMKYLLAGIAALAESTSELLSLIIERKYK